MTSVKCGYPLSGEYGEIGAELTIYYKDKSTAKHIFKNGIDFTLAYTSVGSSRINPVCENATRFARFSYDKNFEEYIINKLDISVENKEIEKITISSLNDNYKILIYGIYAN